MIRIVVIILLSVLSLSAIAIKPIHKIKADGAVTDILKDGNTLYAATDNATINVFSLQNRRLLYKISFPKIKDFMGDIISPKVYDIDKLPSSEAIIAAVQGNRGFANIYIVRNRKPELIIKDIEAKMMVKRVKFIDKNTILLGLLSNELVRYDLVKKKVIYRVQISAYTFSDIVLDAQRKEVITADESGIIHIIDVQTGKILKELSGKNVDNIYQIDYQGSTIICGGQDRRLSIYHRNTSQSYYLQGSFLIYSVGLSPSGKYGAFSANEENEIKVFNTKTKQEVAMLIGSETLITRILFTSESELITSSDDPNILFWKI
ncbi:MAG: WD40 repeat domain-containing protein [Bacteroidetes bacterium]|nr:MAG: WD40 repeat domain-containing protein [Bacteroidota bacterium]